MRKTIFKLVRGDGSTREEVLEEAYAYAEKLTQEDKVVTVYEEGDYLVIILK
jgi:hypothetical protein